MDRGSAIGWGLYRGSIMGPVALGSALDGGSTMEQGFAMGKGSAVEWKALPWGQGPCHGTEALLWARALPWGQGCAMGQLGGMQAHPELHRGAHRAALLSLPAPLSAKVRAEARRKYW